MYISEALVQKHQCHGP